MLWLLVEDEEDHELGSIFMEDEIWSALPQEILFAILGCLPLDSFARFRAVCKQWNALLRNPSSSPFFSPRPAIYNKPCAICKTNQVTRRPPSFVQQEILGIHPSTQQLRRRDQMRLSWRSLVFDFLGPFDCLVSSHAGLLLIRRRSTQYFVCNPLLQASTELPPLPKKGIYRAFTAVFRMNPTSTSFKVIWVRWFTTHGEIIPSFLYDSTTGKWRSIDGGALRNGTLCKNIYYWSTYLSLELLAFDFEEETWNILETKRVPESRPPNDLAIWEWQEQLLMIARDSKRISIWMLSEDNQWNQFDTLMQGTQDAIANGFLPFRCTCMGNVLLFHNSARNKVLAYNFVSKALMIPDASFLTFQSFSSFRPSLQPHWS